MRVLIRWRSRNREAQQALQKRLSEPGIIGKFMIESCGATDPGCVRTNNEDSFLTDSSLGLYVVADGMGGARAGEHASRLAVETVREFVARTTASNGAPDSNVLVEAFHEANRRVMDKAAQDRNMEGMGTTLVAALQSKDELHIANVGDSRLYLFEDGQLRGITEDQTWVNEVGRRLGLDDESLKSHPMRHVLTMAIGVSEDLRVQSYTLQAKGGMQLLLCSDGLHTVASEQDMKRILESTQPLNEKCRALIEAARAQGGPDNITAILLKT